MNFLRSAAKLASNIPGWHTERKIVVIESDDWGSIRMPSADVYQSLLNKGIPVDKDPFCKYDSLASEDDLSCLFEVLNNFKDKNGRSPVFTANSVVANPDFKRIKDSDFEEYYYETFDITLQRYPELGNPLHLWNEGFKKGFFIPQFHGREHLNFSRWLKLLKEKDTATIYGFEMGVFGHAPGKSGRLEYIMAALDGDTEADFDRHKRMLIDGADIFRKMWGMNSKSFIAPCYIWNKRIEETLKNIGVEYIQGILNQLELKKDKYELRYHYLGQQNNMGQFYLIRNAFFEPSINPKFDFISDCLKRASIAFKFNKPLIISTHRLNYISRLSVRNRDNNLLLLKELLNKILAKWPDVEFKSTPELGDTINKI